MKLEEVRAKFGAGPEERALQAEADARLARWMADGRVLSKRGVSGWFPGNLVGKQAPAIRGPFGVYRDAWSAAHDVLAALDHVSMWTMKGHGPVAYVSQPYDPQPEDLKRWEAYAAAHGLIFTASAERSWHYPGRTVLLALEVKGLRVGEGRAA